MPVKKSASSDSVTEIKKAKLIQETRSFPAMAESRPSQSSSCCGGSPSSSAKASPELKKEKSPDAKQAKLPLTSINTSKSECCMATASGDLSADELAHKHSTPLATPPKPEAKKGPKTRIVVRYNVGFDNFLSIRGKGANLSWDKGTHLKNIKHDEWLWETEASFNTCEFKVLINDGHYEIGENHPISCGASIQYTPKF